VHIINFLIIIIIIIIPHILLHISKSTNMQAQINQATGLHNLPNVRREYGSIKYMLITYKMKDESSQEKSSKCGHDANDGR